MDGKIAVWPDDQTFGVFKPGLFASLPIEVVQHCEKIAIEKDPLHANADLLDWCVLNAPGTLRLAPDEFQVFEVRVRSHIDKVLASFEESIDEKVRSIVNEELNSFKRNFGQIYSTYSEQQRNFWG